MKYKQEIKINTRLKSPDYKFINVCLVIDLLLFIFSFTTTLILISLKLIDNICYNLDQKIFVWRANYRLIPNYGIG
jgi:hypothetical protein